MKKTLFSLCAMVLAFSLCAAAGSPAAAEGRVIVSLGDSYSSGEGIEPFYGQDAEMSVKCQNPDWLAHRSEKSWPGMLTLPGVDGPMRDHFGENWFFAAASGARSHHLYRLTEEEIRAGKSAEQERKYNRDQCSGTFLLPPQLDIFDRLDAKGLKADYVTLTIGGNDIGFEHLFRDAMLRLFDVLPFKTPEEKADFLWTVNAVDGGTHGKIKRALTDISARAGSQAVILLAGYPQLLETVPEDNLFTEETIRVFCLFTNRLNEELEKITEECREEGIQAYFVPVADAFHGHDMFADDPWINPVFPGSKAQDLESLRLFSMYSVHPNEQGARAYAACMQKEIDRLEAGPNP